ncbi:hypothetical protein PV325_008967 [Microctonus aethiopoides]|uniref:Uncharacterized protein n=1 Tax=Microctonus aethiopoides TaxID=144406 RepID=A0AA39C6Z4_9HYME|nr:hypothetical protein PV325_008967 [Microctonus aethiopoides]KAK0159071.1 hypothetical protein PV328_009998 [Microctonus aethiopoides]
MSDEVKQWCPTISEIRILLQQLNLSPPHSDYEDDIFLVDEQLSTDIFQGNYTESVESNATIIIGELNRDKLMEELLEMRKDEIINKWKNNWFHENLVKHFTKKQMIHVCCTDDNDDNIIWNEYMKTLCNINELKRKIELNNEQWDVELSMLRKEICKERQNEKLVVDQMISRGKIIEKSVWKYGKSFSAKHVQELISKQLEKIKQISQNRFRYTKLCASFISMQESLNLQTAKNTNLTKSEYEQLEAEKFYYQMIMQDKKFKCEQLITKKIILKDEINSVRMKILQLSTEICVCNKIIDEAKRTINKLLRTNTILRKELTMKKKFIYTFEELFSNGMNEMIRFKLTEVRGEHEKWIKKIANILNSIKHINKNLNAVEINLILQEKKY